MVFKFKFFRAVRWSWVLCSRRFSGMPESVPPRNISPLVSQFPFTVELLQLFQLCDQWSCLDIKFQFWSIFPSEYRRVSTAIDGCKFISFMSHVRVCQYLSRALSVSCESARVLCRVYIFQFCLVWQRIEMRKCHRKLQWSTKWNHSFCKMCNVWFCSFFAHLF